MSDYGSESDTDDLLRTSKLPEPLRLAQLLEQTMQSPLHGKAADCLRKMHAAARQALEVMRNQGDVGVDEWIATETALRTAIEAAEKQQALDKKAENARELGLDYEPVWDNLPSNKDVEDAMRMRRLNQLATPPAAPVQELKRYSPDGVGGMEVDSLGAYVKLQDITPPAAQRQWVDLTDEEVKYEWEAWKASLPRYAGFAKGIEAKLREKNGGAA